MKRSEAIKAFAEVVAWFPQVTIGEATKDRWAKALAGEEWTLPDAMAAISSLGGKVRSLTLHDLQDEMRELRNRRYAASEAAEVKRHKEAEVRHPHGGACARAAMRALAWSQAQAHAGHQPSDQEQAAIFDRFKREEISAAEAEAQPSKPMAIGELLGIAESA